jgi:flavin-dependent dehydrogenase
MAEIDLVIAGAGPAGLSLALHLLQADPAWAGRMLLLEKAAHPRPKLCGGAVTRLGLDTLQCLGFPLPLPVPQAQVDDVRMMYAGRTVHVRGRPQLAIFHRAELDAFLAEEAQRRGARICQNEAVTGFAIDPDGVTVTTSRGRYRAKALAGADGSKGAVRQALNRGERRSRVARLLEVIAPAAETDPPLAARYALFDFTPVKEGLQGYTWDFPARVGGEPASNRGVYDARLAAARPRAGLKDLLEAALIGYGGDPAAPPQGHPIHWFSPRARLAQPRLILVGDAAGADPLFGEGIAPALATGRVAAESIQRAFAAGDFSFKDYRLRLWRAPAGRYLLIRWAVAWWSYHFSGHASYMHFMWTLGQIINTLWPAPPPLYE